MSLKEFWLGVRTGARLITPKATADSPRLDPAKIERILKEAPIWLTPKSVERYDPADFDFLLPAERQALSEAVDRFRSIARQVPPDQPATPSQVQQALPQFLRIVEILRPDKYADPEALVIGKKVEQQLASQFPPLVSELRFETGADSTGDPALWIWVVLKDEATKKDFLANMRNVRESLEGVVSELGVPRFPYVRFRTVSELESLNKKTRK